MSPEELGLPYDDWRPGQLEAIAHIAASRSRFTVVGAPTGSGKSGIALALARLVGPPAYILTATKELQDQYLRSAPDAATVRGRTNFECAINPQDHAGNAICTLGISCEHMGVGPNAVPGCAYYDQLREALEANIVIFNYAYYLNERRYVQRFPDPKILICDEAHLLRGCLESFGTADLRIADFTNAGIPWPPMEMEFEPEDSNWWYGWAHEHYQFDDPGCDPTDPRSIRAARAHRSIERAAVSILRAGNQGTVVVPLPGGAGVSVRPLWGSRFGHALFYNAERVVFLTATPGSASDFARSVGVWGDCEEIAIPSNFDPRRRPVYYWPVSKISGRDPRTWTATLDAIVKIMYHHPNEKGLIHTVSYRLGAAIMGYLQENYPDLAERAIFPDSSERDRALARFRTDPGPRVLLSPSLTSGVDLPFDLCRFVVIPKLPFPDKSDPVIAARAQFPEGKRLALADTVNTLVQAAGRAMRDEEDYGVTWLLDSNWKWVRHAGAAYLPTWFTDAVVAASL